MRPERAHFLTAGACLILVCVLVAGWVGSAGTRFADAQLSAKSKEHEQAVATASDVGYCTRDLKQILRRVLTSCGLVKKDQGRGCQPLEAKNVAAMSGNDFNSLFKPLAKRAAIIQFEKDKFDLDDNGKLLLEKIFSDQQGASYFLVVSRASPEGSVEHNRSLSENRATVVLDHLKEKFKDPDLEREVGLLWLGEEFAQLEEEFCKWNRSGTEGTCTSAELNRSAFIAWIDCRL